ncbi:hypothetical protein G6F16_012009 [Rhizopus arrhizus]|uniref:Uncharacterized protein n=1 Tax=Rhizopus oryzae TaxID=64495 RepID=A0A9P6WYJ1_RHIOR|nr:hypothetical protein G6F23_010014 [Rhizopus arrhizus]KAG0754980.1 hypothetical protein G6F24_012129 [Rhizopus arrhizus]KAG0781211.1 hypothetical protein G6F21_011764 [Rhizopus arrhizus]KAG0783247.1 hypothetical protein G6F22_008763 [Rhizopus arrhizus]KAG0805387.1 hypothetical protein G6F20_011949 [Rhizopus arrhizus]
MSTEQDNNQTIATLQQQLIETRQLLDQVVAAQQQQADMPSATQDSQMHTNSSHLVPSPWHSLGVRPQYDWVPPELLTQCLQLDQDLFSTSNLLPDDERKRLIEAYPPIRDLEYRAPATLPDAQKRMNKAQQLEDSSLREIQYMLSGVFRPLDILGHELLQATNTPADVLQRNLNILFHARTLLSHACASLTHSRNKIAMRAVNPRFSLPTPGTNKKYTMDLNEFQSSITQQTTSAKTMKEAQHLPNQNRRQFHRQPAGNNFRVSDAPFQSNSAHPGSGPQFFRSGPSSQHGGQSHHANNGNHGNNQRQFNPNNPYRGRLQLFSPQWSQLFQNDWVNSVITHGFKIPFHTSPPLSTHFHQFNHNLSADQSQLLDTSISELLTKQAIELVDNSQDCLSFISPMFLRRLSSLQNGDSSTGLIDDRTRRLHDINRYVGCLPSPSGSSGLSALPPVPLEGSDVSIQDDSIRSLDSPLLVHQDHSSNLGMGSPTRDSSQCLPRRLDHSRQDERRSIDEHQQDSSVPYTPGLDCQLEKISTNTKDDLGTPRLRIGFSDDVSSTSGKETSRPASINSTTDQQTSPDAESDSECDHENTSSNNGDLSSSTLHTTPVTPEEQPDPPPSRLGSPTPTDERQHCGTEMVVEQSTTVERPVDSSIDSSSHTVRGCQQHGLGMRVPEPSGTRLLDSSGSPDVDQLARTESGLSGTPDIPEPAEHDGPHPHRQYDFNGIHKQTRRYEVLQSDDISDNAVEMVSTPRPNAHSKSRVGFRQHRSGLRVQKIFHKKPLASQTPGLQEPPSVAMGSSRGRSVCGPNKQPPRKVRIVEERSGGMEDRRLLSELEQASEPSRKSLWWFPIGQQLFGILCCRV